jgi:hypothetical protein
MDFGGEPLACHVHLFDRDRGWHHARKERMQGTAIISVVSALIAVMVSGRLAVAVVMVGVNGNCRLRRALERRHDDAGELGGQKERNQHADEPLYRS